MSPTQEILALSVEVANQVANASYLIAGKYKEYVSDSFKEGLARIEELMEEGDYHSAVAAYREISSGPSVICTHLLKAAKAQNSLRVLCDESQKNMYNAGLRDMVGIAGTELKSAMDEIHKTANSLALVITK
jgi:hypothetical protein